MDNKTRLQDWHDKKQKIEQIQNAVIFRPREVWWCHVGQNIGAEIYGKGDEFLRPVYIYKIINKYKFIGIPLSTKYSNFPQYYPVNINNRDGALCLHEIKCFSTKRLKFRIKRLVENQHAQIVTKLVSYLAS